MHMSKLSRTEVIGIASGKGGVGKTTISVNLALSLQRQGHRVMLFDADLGLANAQIVLGLNCPFNLSHFLNGEKTLQEILVTAHDGLILVPGGSGIKEMASISSLQASAIVQAFSNFEEDIDYLIVDMAAGISPSVLAFMAACQRRFIVVKDDPSSIADAYGTIKVLTQDFDEDEIYLIPNSVASQAEGQMLYERINKVCAQFLNRSVHYLGAIESDEQILKAHKKYIPVVDFAPASSGARDFRLLAEATQRLKPLETANGGLQFFVERLLQA